MESNIRKLENSLVTIGTGVVILSLWTLFKIILYMIVYLGEIKDVLGTLPHTEAAFVIVLIAAAVVIELVLHCFVGLSAIGEGRGKRKRPVYLIVTGFIIVLYLAAILLELSLLFFFKAISLTFAVSMVIDVTSTGLIIDMFVASVRLRKLKKQKAEKEGAAI